MNKRIKELENLATEVVHTHGEFGEYEADRRLNSEKFAQLIIKECATVLDSLDESYDAPKTHSKFLLEYFGIKK